MNKKDLIEHLEKDVRVFVRPGIKEAFVAIDRADFVGEDYLPEAYEDYALPIGHGRTDIKPSFAAFMLELLDIKPGERILEVGSGSGWMTALLAHRTGTSGHVYATEHVPELLKLSRKNLAKYPSLKTEVTQAGDKLGRKQDFLYDKILVNGSSDDAAGALIGQLKVGGKMLIPIDTSLFLIEKNSNQNIERTEYPGFNFQPLA